MKAIVCTSILSLLLVACKSSSKSISIKNRSQKVEKIGTGNYKVGYDDVKDGGNGVCIFN